MISNYYIEDENILHRKRTGNVDLEELIASIKSLSELYNDQKQLNVIEDTRDSLIDFTVDDYDEIISALVRLSDAYEVVKCAYVASDPHSTAMSILFESDSLKLQNFKYKTFATIEAAKEWLHSNNGE